MSGITIVSPEGELEVDLQARYRGKNVVRQVWSDAWPSPASAVVEISAAAPDVVILGAELPRDDALDLLIEIDRTQPNVGVVVLRAEPSTEDTVEFLRSGARDVLAEDSPIEKIGESLDNIVKLLEQRRTNLTAGRATKRRVIAVLSPKGGTGKTTIAVNVALGMAKRAKNQVLLVDLDVQFGDAAPALGLLPEFSLANTMGLDAMDRASMKVFLTLHESSLAVLSPPDDFAAAETIDATGVKNALGAYSDEFPYVVIDTAGGIDDFSLLAMEFATDLVFVATTDISSIRAVKRQLDALDQLGLIGHRRHFVLNRADSKAGLSTSDIEGTLGMRTTIEIPVSRGMPLASNQGEPLLGTDGRDSAIRPLEELVELFMPDDSGGSNRGLRLFSRKD